MTPVARLVLTFFAAFPVQRALIAVVALASIAAVGFALVANAPAAAARWVTAGGVVATLASAFVTFPCFMACGTLFAALSAPRTFLLLPHFRRYMLAAVVLVFAVGIAPVIALVTYVPQPGIVPAILGYGFAFFTIFVWASTLAPAVLILLPLALVPALHLLASLNANAGTVVAPTVLAVASAGAWAVFARPYLRGEPIAVRSPILRDLLAASAPPDGKLTAGERWSTDTSAEALTRNACRVLLNGQLPTRPWRQLVMLSASVVLVSLWVSFLFRLAPRLGEAPLFLLPFVIVPLNAFVAARAMRRARLLWLLGPERTAIFRIVEKTAIRPFLAFFGGGVAALTFALAVWHEGLAPATAALVAAALLAYGALAAYVGLVFARGFGAATLLAALAYAGAFVYTLLCAAGAPEAGPALAGSAGLALAAAGLCRYAALRRWRTVDWIALRPPRGTWQRSRAAGV